MKLSPGQSMNADRHIPRVLVVAPSPEARGGIASVVHLHMKMSVWREMRCRLLPTYFDGSASKKISSAAFAYARAPFAVGIADLVHIHVAGESSLLRKLPIVGVARLFRKPLIVHVHAHSTASLFDKTPAWAVRYVLGGADRVIALSESWAREIRGRLPDAYVEVIPNPVNSCVTGGESRPRKRAVLFAGKLEPRKGYDLLLDAAPAVLARHPEVEFWFAGHGELDRASAKAEQLGISSSVRLLGWTDQEALSQLYREALVFCLPSYNEGVPMAVLEAMSNATPVVCTPVGGLPQVITDGHNGLFCSVGDPVSIAEKLNLLLDDSALADRVAVEAQRTAVHSNGRDIVEARLRNLWLRLSRHSDAPFAAELEPDR